MQWTKIPTNILINRLTDQEIVSIVKYQLLWADLEYQPDEKTALRYLTPKQLSIAHQYLDSMESQVTRDVRSSETNRRYRKLNYLKTNKNSENVSITLPITVSNTLQQQNRIEKNNIYIQDSLSASAENPSLFNNTESDKPDFPTSAEKKTRQRKTCQSSLKCYGELRNVLLTEDEYSSLAKKYMYIDKAIEELDSWLGKESKAAKQYIGKDHYAFFKSNGWVWDKISKESPKPKYHKAPDSFIENEDDNHKKVWYDTATRKWHYEIPLINPDWSKWDGTNYLG